MLQYIVKTACENEINWTGVMKWTGVMNENELKKENILIMLVYDFEDALVFF